MSDTTIRGFELGDWEDVAEIFLCPGCRWGTFQLPYTSRDTIRKRLESRDETIHSLVAVDQASGKVIGMASLHRYRGRRQHTAHIGMAVHDDHQDRGVGTLLMEALVELGERWLDLRRIELQVYVDNPRAKHLYEKFGFETEGTMRDFAFRDGEFVDAYTMARLRRADG